MSRPLRVLATGTKPPGHDPAAKNTRAPAGNVLTASVVAEHTTALVVGRMSLVAAVLPERVYVPVLALVVPQPVVMTGPDSVTVKPPATWVCDVDVPKLWT